jgi:hypothetical protein
VESCNSPLSRRTWHGDAGVLQTEHRSWRRRQIDRYLRARHTPTPAVTMPDTVMVASRGDPGVSHLATAVPDLMPKLPAARLQGVTPAERFTDNDGSWQIQLTTGERFVMPPLTLADELAPYPS